MSAPAAPIEPGSSYAQPFELLAACHERILRSLALLQRLLEHLGGPAGADAAARSAACDLLRYFDLAAPLHHQDEERHVFPPLEAGADPGLHQACAQLREDHRQMAAQWQDLRAPLLQVQAGQMPDELPHFAAQAQAFARLHEQHLRTEETLVFPSAQARLEGQDLRGAMSEMGAEMAGRRGLRLNVSTGPGSR